MSWSEKYKLFIDNKKKLKNINDDYLKNDIFSNYVKFLNLLYLKLKEIIRDTPISIQIQKIKVSKELTPSLIGEKEELDSLILTDTDNEVQFIPEGINFIGIFGRVKIKAFKKIYAFQSIIQKNLKYLREPYLFLIKNKDTINDDEYVWGYIPNDNYQEKIIERVNDSILEKILDEVFINDPSIY